VPGQFKKISGERQDNLSGLNFADAVSRWKRVTDTSIFRHCC